MICSRYIGLFRARETANSHGRRNLVSPDALNKDYVVEMFQAIFRNSEIKAEFIVSAKAQIELEGKGRQANLREKKVRDPKELLQ